MFPRSAECTLARLRTRSLHAAASEQVGRLAARFGEAPPPEDASSPGEPLAELQAAWRRGVALLEERLARAECARGICVWERYRSTQY